MADVTSGAIWAAVTGAAAAALSELGIPPGVLAAGAMGAILGAPAAPSVGRLWQMLMFFAVTTGCAILAVFLAGGPKAAQMAWSFGLASLFHPLLAAAKGLLPQALAALLRLKHETKESKDGGA